MADIYASLEHWVDTRALAGQVASGSVHWRGGIWASWFEAARSGYALDGNPPWGSSTSWTWGTVDAGVRAPATGQFTSTTLPGLGRSGSYQVTTASIYGSRLLARAPIAIDSVEGGVAVSMGGKTYRTTYGQRRLWQIDLLLNGPQDMYRESAYADMRTRWPLFLQLAELGCTLYMSRASGAWTNTGTQTSRSTPFYGTPYRITGQLVDATQVRWATPSGRQARWEVTVTIAEQEPAGYTG